MHPGLFVIGNEFLSKAHPGQQRHDADVAFSELDKGIHHQPIDQNEIRAAGGHVSNPHEVAHHEIEQPGKGDGRSLLSFSFCPDGPDNLCAFFPVSEELG